MVDVCDSQKQHVDESREKITELSEQVKQLINTESKLYKIQEQLDLQLTLYRELFEAGKKLSSIRDENGVYELFVDYCVNKLNYERAIVFSKTGRSANYFSAVFDGYYEEEDESYIRSIKLNSKSDLLQCIKNINDYYVFNSDFKELSANEKKQGILCGRALLMDEYILIPLGQKKDKPIVLLAVGNTIKQMEYLSRVDKDNESFVNLGSLASLVDNVLQNLRLYEELENERKLLEQRVIDRTHKLKESEAKANALVEFSPDGIVIANESAQIVKVNHQAEQLLGYNRSELLGEGIDTIIPSGSNRSNSLQDIILSNPHLTNIQTGMEYKAKRKDGMMIPVEVELGSLDEQNELLVLATFRDISGRKDKERLSELSVHIGETLISELSLQVKLQHCCERFVEHLQGAVLCRIWAIDAKTGNLESVAESGSLSQAKGAGSIVEKETVTGELEKSLATYVTKSMHPYINKEFLHSPSETDEGGKESFISFYGFPIQAENTAVGVLEVMALLPISQDAEKTLQILANGIAVAIRREHAESDLVTAKEVAEEATRTKSAFLAAMSHEIRTPMNAIIGLTNLALKTELTDKQSDYLVKVDRSAQSLLGIINDILDFSKIEAGKLHIEEVEFDLERVMDNLSNLIAQKASDKALEFAISIDSDVPLNLIGDPLRVGQILINYCSNAIKFTDRGEVVVSVKVKESKGDRVVLQFSVKDTGIGLGKDQIDKMFRSFSQADSSTTRKYGGTGLGLAISKRLSELMKGKVWVESTQGVGSTFYFTAEFTAQEDQKRKSYKPTSDLVNLPVLVCDDNETAREIMSDALATFQFSVTMAKNGAEAIEMIKTRRENPFKLLIIDNKMPGMSGLEVAETISKDTDIETPKMIMVTGFGKEDLVDRVKECGIGKILSKPISYSLLFDSIMEELGKNVRTERTHEVGEKKYQDAFEGIGNARILLVEDNEINQQIAIEHIEAVNLRVDVADDGQIAVEKIKLMTDDDPYNLVLMDIQMPVLDGYGATIEIRKSHQFDSVPIVAMTADAMSGVKERCLRAGMQDYITKPINVDELYRTIVKWIKKDEVKVQSKPQSVRPARKQEKVHAFKEPNMENMNIKEALQRVGGNEKLFLSLIGRFYESNQDFSSRLNDAMESGDQSTAVRTAHTLKGLAGNIGANQLQQRAKVVESALRSGVSDVKRDDLDELYRTLEQAQIEIKEKILSQLQDESSDSVELASVEALLGTLRTKLENYESDALKVLQEIGNIKGHESECKTLSQMISGYQFDEAIEVLNRITGQ